jgi:hypothetical protein
VKVRCQVLLNPFQRQSRIGTAASETQAHLTSVI